VQQRARLRDHAITLSARTRRKIGTVRPSAQQRGSTNLRLLDHLVSDSEQRRRNGDRAPRRIPMQVMFRLSKAIRTDCRDSGYSGLAVNSEQKTR
jgi:hypothetical protein